MQMNKKGNIINNYIKSAAMKHVSQKTYKGWEITIRCTCIASKVNHPKRYTAIASAELLSGEDPDNWVDPRVQVLTTGGRSFSGIEECTDVLLIEARELIDALRK